MRPSARDEPTGPAPQETTRPATPNLPLYHQVYAQLRERLDSGHWKPGDRMPTEDDLVAEFGVSLITVRRALEELVRENRIQRTRGRGTFVLDGPLERELTELSSFTDEMRVRGLTARTELLSAALEEAGPRAAELLGLTPGAAVYTIERLRFVADSPLMLERVQLPAQLVPGLLDEDLASGSLYDILAARHGIELLDGEESLSPALPTPAEATQLNQDRRQPVLLLELVSRTPDGTPVEYCRSVVRGDRARYHFEVRRQRPSLTLVTPPAPPR
ncbi:MAG: GntR family transcriptional regulator [Microbacteriaceae bacterium]|nr:GntR family transcriptional regulator [Microbacteriaceae bacterium]